MSRLFSRTHPSLFIAWLILGLYFVWQRLSYTLPTDVSWLISVSERVLAGEALYKDIIEVNPPFSLYLYLPIVALAQLLKIKPEILVNIYGVAAFALSFCLCASLLRKTSVWQKSQPDPTPHHLAGLAIAVVLLMLPQDSFTQREHLAVLAILPALSIMVLRLENAALPRSYIGIGAVASALTVCIKPYFVLCLILPALYAAIRNRRWQLLFVPEYLIGAGLALIYAASVFVFQPEFVGNLLPVLNETYLVIRRPAVLILREPFFMLWCAIVAAVYILAGKNRSEPLINLPVLSAIGFMIVCLVQGKGWAYHILPFFQLALVALILAIWQRWQTDMTSRFSRLLTASLAIVFMLSSALWFSRGGDPSRLREAVARVVRASHLTSPRIMTITDNLGIGHPLSRSVSGKWIMHVPSLWLTDMVHQRLAHEQLDDATRDRLLNYEKAERKRLHRDFQVQHPDIVLVHLGSFLNWRDWLNEDAELSQEISRFTAREAVTSPDGSEIIVIMSRTDLPHDIEKY